MPPQAHPLVQYSRDTDAVPPRAVDDDVRSDKVDQVCRRQIATTVAYLRVAADRLQGILDLVAVRLKLLESPGLTGEPKNVDEVLAGLRR